MLKIKILRYFLSFIFLTGIFCPGFTTNYYISGSGNDSNPGKTESKPWKTIKRINEQKLKPGDSVLFQAGYTYIGSLHITNSGKENLPVVITGYGDGVDPIISGAIDISEFTRENDSILSCSVTENIKNLYRNGEILKIARFPDDGFLIMDGGGENFLTEENLPFSENILTNATVRMRTVNWQYETRKIEQVDGNMLRFDSVLFNHSKDTFTCKNGWGYYIENKRGFLSREGEWIYDSSLKKLFLYHKGKQNDFEAIKGSVYRDAVTISNGVSYIEIKGITFSKFNGDGICLPGDNKNISISHCAFQNIYKTAVNGGVSCSFISIRDCQFRDIYGRGIFLLESNDCVIKNNELRRIGMIPGYGIDGVNGGAGIIITSREHPEDKQRKISHNNYIGYNIVDSTGYGCIRIDGKNSICEYNIVSHALLTLNDGGMIYCWGTDTAFTHHNIIRNNILQHNIGNTEGAPSEHLMNLGIYIDNNTHHITVENNIVRGVGSAIHINDGSFSNTIRGNICYGNKTAISFAEWNWKNLPEVCEKNICTGNILFNTFNLEHTLSLQHTYSPDFNPGIIDSNVYASPAELYHIKKATMEDGCKITREYTLDSWKKAGGHDENSTFVKADGNTKSMIFINDKAVQKEFTLYHNIKYKLIDGTSIKENIIVQPYSAMILLYTVL